MSDEDLRKLERDAQAGLVDPARVLAELDRRGALSRGREIVLEWPTPGVWQRRRNSYWTPGSRARLLRLPRWRQVGKGLGPGYWTPDDCAQFRSGFLHGYLAREGAFNGVGAAVVACDGWLYMRRMTLDFAQDPPWYVIEPNVLRRVRDHGLEVLELSGSLGQRLPAGVLVGFGPDGSVRAVEVGDVVLGPLVSSRDGISVVRISPPDDGLTREFLAPPPPKPSKAQLAREKTRANVRRRPPRRLPR